MSSMQDISTNTQMIQFGEIGCRVTVKDDRPWFVAADVCQCLGLKNSRDVATAIPDNEKDVVITDTPGGPQQMTVVNEPGLYRLIFKSRKPEAERFKTWIFSEVIPSLRKHGVYPPPNESGDEAGIAGRSLAVAKFYDLIQEREQALESYKTNDKEMRAKFDSQTYGLLSGITSPWYMRDWATSYEEKAKLISKRAAILAEINSLTEKLNNAAKGDDIKSLGIALQIKSLS